MKKALLGTTALMLALGMGTIARADSSHGWTNVDADINWTKDVQVQEYISREKAIFIRATPVLTPAGAAEASALATVGHKEVEFNIRHHHNNGSSGSSSGAGYSGSYSGDEKITAEAKINNAIHNNSGVISVNQDIGLMNNQGNLVSFGVTSSVTAAADSQAETEQYNQDSKTNERGAWRYTDNTTDGLPNGTLSFSSKRTATLVDTIYAQTGITGVNETSGVANNQTNSLALAVGLSSSVALSEAALGQTTSGNDVKVADFSYGSSVSNAVNTNRGITHVNQSAGNLNNQSSTIAFSATAGTNQATAGVVG